MMAATGGFIQLHRKIVEWEWYANTNTFRVFLHCLLMANFTDGRFEGVEVKRGQFVTSLPNLAKQTLLTIQQVRTALDHLKSTGEITDKAYAKFRVITVVKYDMYQQDNRQNNSQSTGNQQATNRRINRQSTDESTPSIEYIEYIEPMETSLKRCNKNNNNNHQSKRFVKPTVDEVRKYCLQRKNWVDWDEFYAYYEANGWKVGKGPMKDWKAAIRYWEPKAKAKAEREGLI